MEGSLELSLERSLDLHANLAEATDIEEKSHIIKEYIEKGHTLKLPLVPDFERGNSWIIAHPAFGSNSLALKKKNGALCRVDLK